MQNMSDDELDKLFKEAAEEFKTPHDPSAWQDMSSKLDQHTTPSGFWNWKSITVTTFVGLTGIALLWYIGVDKQDTSSSVEISHLNAKNDQRDDLIVPSDSEAQDFTDQNDDGIKRESTVKSKAQSPQKSIANLGTPDESEERILAEQGNLIKTQNPDQETPVMLVDTNKPTESVSVQSSTAEPVKPIVPETTSIAVPDLGYSRNDLPKSDSSITNDSLVAEGVKKDILLIEDKKVHEEEEEKSSSSKNISIRLAISPDFSSINFFTPDKPGFNYGLLVGYSFNTRWSVYSGVISSRKIYSSDDIEEPYSTGGNDYPVNQLDGDCRVLDIPINIYYTFFPDRSFSIKAGLGISSYLMLSEDYTYHVDNPYGYDTYTQNIEGKNNEWFKMLNVSVVLQKRINNRFTFEVEPFVKAPLAGVGEGEVSLVSLGAFLNLRFDIPIVKKD